MRLALEWPAWSSQLTRSNRCVKMFGTKRSAIPNDNAAPRMNRSRRVYCINDKTRRPDTYTHIQEISVSKIDSNNYPLQRRQKERLSRLPRLDWGLQKFRILNFEHEIIAKGHVLARRAPDIFRSIPNRIKNTQHQRPADRLAHRVREMTPLFYSESIRYPPSRDLF